MSAIATGTTPLRQKRAFRQLAGTLPDRRARYVDCAFCAIVAGRAESVIVWDDDRVVAFMDHIGLFTIEGVVVVGVSVAG